MMYPLGMLQSIDTIVRQRDILLAQEVLKWILRRRLLSSGL